MLESVVYNTLKQSSGQQLGCCAKACQPTSVQDEQREFMIIVRRALLLIVRWIEKRYDLSSS